jgi:hypothetical protein
VGRKQISGLEFASSSAHDPLPVMPEPPGPIPYARAVADDVLLARWLRRAVGWAAAVYGASSSAAMAYFIALTRKWISAPVDLGRFSRVQDVIASVEAAAHLLLSVAGVLVLRRHRLALAALRVAAGAALLTGYAQQTYNVIAERSLGFFFPYTASSPAPSSRRYSS